MRDGSYVIVDRLCEATTQLLEIIKKQEEIIEQCRISDELHKELDDVNYPRPKGHGLVTAQSY